MIKATVNEAADLFDVTPKTIREWIREGMPVHKAGDKGSGNGAIIDLVRAQNWRRQRERIPPPAWAEYFASHPDHPPNPLRWLVESYADDMQRVTGIAMAKWYSETGNGNNIDWKRMGMTDAQARWVVWNCWSLVVLMMEVYKSAHYEKNRVGHLADGGDLDDLASLWFCGDISSTWKDEIQVPEALREFAPRDKIFKVAGGRKASK